MHGARGWPGSIAAAGTAVDRRRRSAPTQRGGLVTERTERAATGAGVGTAAEDPVDDVHPVDDGSQRTVLVRVGATAAQLPTLRVVAADLAARADFDIDAVSDLRLAVDEVAAELVALAAPGALLTVTFLVDSGQIAVTASVPVERGAVLRQDSFGWRVLSTLVDAAHVLHGRDRNRPVLGITLHKKRPDETGTGRR